MQQQYTYRNEALARLRLDLHAARINRSIAKQSFLEGNGSFKLYSKACDTLATASVALGIEVMG